MCTYAHIHIHISYLYIHIYHIVICNIDSKMEHIALPGGGGWGAKLREPLVPQLYPILRWLLIYTGIFVSVNNFVFGVINYITDESWASRCTVIYSFFLEWKVTAAKQWDGPGRCRHTLP